MVLSLSQRRIWLITKIPRLEVICAQQTFLGGLCEDDVRDVVQETALRAWADLEKCVSARSQEAWLAGIARNVVRESVRASEEHASLPAGANQVPDLSRPAPPDLLRVRDVLDQHRGTVTPKQRQALLAYCSCRSVRRAASSLLISRAGLHRRMQRGTAALRLAVRAQEMGARSENRPKGRRPFTYE